jgi:hypothetical protein
LINYCFIFDLYPFKEAHVLLPKTHRQGYINSHSDELQCQFLLGGVQVWITTSLWDHGPRISTQFSPLLICLLHSSLYSGMHGEWCTTYGQARAMIGLKSRDTVGGLDGVTCPADEVLHINICHRNLAAIIPERTGVGSFHPASAPEL